MIFMGRKLMRVPLDFNWPTDMVWKGYINPYKSQECKACDGSGHNPETKKLSDDWYSFDNQEWIYPDGHTGRRYNNLAWSNHITQDEVIELAKHGRLSDLMDKWYNYDKETNVWTYCDRNTREWIVCDEPNYPTAEKVNNWNRTGIGHDSMNQWICVETRAKRLGVWGECEYCNGNGEIWASEEVEKLHDEWNQYDPPTGEGYQLWETTSEGSPQSPVFKTLDELCEWCAENATTFGSFKATKDEWKGMLDDDFVSHQEGNIIFI
jgi:hypothetical protein